MKKILLGLFIISTQFSLAQNTIFHENFDLPSGPDSVTTGVASGGSVALWDTVSFVAFSPNNSYRVKGSQNPSSVYFVTSSFSTIGNPYVRLEFNQIAKLYTANWGRIQISIDNGQTWTTLNANQYIGSDTSFANLNYFNHVSHQRGSISPWKFNNSLALPNNTWWKKEMFDLTGVASDTSGPAGSYTGYPNVKLRFLADFNSKLQPQNTGFSAGWFVDNLNVLASSCEVAPPKVSTDLQVVPCYNNLPRGLIIKKTNNNYPIGILASDTSLNDSGIDRVKIYYQINNGSPDSTDLVQQGSSLEYKTNLSTISPGDTVTYHIVAYDNCGNETRLPANDPYYRFIPDNTYYNKCGSSLCDQYPGYVNSFSWQENFESSDWTSGFGSGIFGNQHRGSIPTQSNGGWNVFPDSAANYGWSVRTGPTGTIETGPNGDHTSGNGKYLYVEFTPSTNTSSTSLTTPCIDLSGSSKRIMSFYYHMFGSDISDLRVDIDTGSSNPDFWIGYYQLNGPQQFSSDSEWRRAFIDLSAFQGDIIRVRFTANFVPPGDKSDVAIDDLEIFNAPPADVKLNELLTKLESSCIGNSNIPISVNVQNLGSQQLNEVPLAFQLNNNSIVRDTLRNVALQTVDTANFSFSQRISLTPLSNNSLKVWTELPNDNRVANDTFELDFQASLGTKILNFPYYQDFESTSVLAGASDILDDTSWTLNTTSLGGYFELVNSLQNDTRYGPFWGLGPNKKMLVLSDTSSSSQIDVEFTSSCIDLTNATNPELRFLYDIGANGMNLEVLIREVGNPWSSLTNFSYSASLKSFTSLSVPLNLFAGKSIQLKFRAYGSSQNFNHRDVTIDNIQLIESNQNDISLHYVSKELERLAANTMNVRPFTTEYSISGSGIVNSKLVVEYTSLCDSVPSVYTAEKLMSNTASGGMFSPSHNSMTFNDSISAGKYGVKVWIESMVDSIHFNDTIYFESEVVERQSVPYYNDFESCASEFYGNGQLRQWELTQPAGGAQSGSMAFETNASRSLITENNSPEILLPPFFEGLDTIAGAELRFWHKFTFSGPVDSCYGKVEYLNSSSNWKNLTTSIISGQNWKSLMNFNNSDGYVFNGSSSGWVFSSYPLDHVKSGLNVFRFSTSNPLEYNANWVIDDFEIYVPAQYSASPDNLLFNSGLPSYSNNISIRIFNSGRKAINSATVTIQDENGNQLIQEQLNLQSPLAWQQSRDVALQSTLNLTNAIDELVIITSLPNSRNDAMPSDDTLRLTVKILQPVDSMPYCENFEDSAAYLPYGNGIKDTLWQYIYPLKNVIFGTHSGNRAWITGSQGSYPALVDKHLYTPALPIEEKTCYKFSFWHWYDTEYNFDGGNVEFSLDTGKTWNVLGGHNDTTWYNTPFVQSLDGINPGFSGSSGDWTKAYKEFKVFFSGLIQFRFRFASNASIGGNGWAIDDVCFEEVGGNCHEVSLKEIPNSSQQVSLFPNPASSQLNLLLSQAKDEVELAKLKIYDRTGKVIRQWTAKIQAGKTLKIDISKLPAGIYSLALDIDNSLTVKNFSKR